MSEFSKAKTTGPVLYVQGFQDFSVLFLALKAPNPTARPVWVQCF
jgi:hypothetical protein